MKRIILVAFFIYFLFITGHGQSAAIDIPKKIYTTQKIETALQPKIDGRLDDLIWNTANWSGSFIQREPTEGALPSESTAFSIIYDEQYLYIGIKCFDAIPSSINHRMSRRDGFEGDWVEIIIDSYHDLRSAFSLTTSAAGVKGDKMITLNGEEEDLNWNPVWYTRSDINEFGWTTEMKIPFSQLRFGDEAEQIWGLQVVRRLFRKEEKSTWQRVPIDAAGWISEFGKLHGLKNLKSQQQLELQAFSVASLKTIEKQEDNPYRNKNIKQLNFGLDGKIGVTNDLTLDFTINPDFGQVEADPAAIALDGFQLFFQEQRPFFVENKNIFDYRFSAPIIGGTFSSDNLFYSRRIGRKPQGELHTESGSYTDIPERTSILGAVKFSGKTNKGLSIGVLESVTAAEYGAINRNGETEQQLVEPLTNYFVGRVQRDFNHKNTFIGGIFTATNRKIEENVNALHESAYTTGLDFKHQWNNRSWYVGANLVTSHVEGSKLAILNTQTSIRHLYQRVDASHLEVDSSRTFLNGLGGDLRIGKAGQGRFRFETGVTWRTAGLELNDLGFMREADDIQNYASVIVNSLQPFSIFRKMTVDYKHWLVWDFEGNFNYHDWDVEANAVFNNNWNATFGLFSQPHIYSKSLLRGGPRIYLPDQYGAWWALGSDQRKKLFFDLYGWTKMGNSDSYFLFNSGIRITYQALNQFNIAIEPRYTSVQYRLQYNETVKVEATEKYITSRLDQETLSAALRLNYALSPNFSIQYYAEPYISIGSYQDFSYVVNPLAQTQQEQLYFFDQKQLSMDRTKHQFLVDENKDGIVDYQFADPNFAFTQFRSNLVLRWEYFPGSELFLVWSQGMTDYTVSDFGIREGIDRQLFQEQAENTFLMKLTYRFIRGVKKERFF